METLNNRLDVLTDEESRLECLRSYNLLDTQVESEFEELNHLAASICSTPVALIVLLDRDRQWFKSKYGWDKSETEKAFSFCNYTILENSAVLEVEDALLDSRFSQNPLVTGEPNIRYYCGAPLISPEGCRLGALCVIDKVPRKLSTTQKDALVVLSKQIVTHFVLRKQKDILKEEKARLEIEVNKKTQNLISVNNELKTFIYKASHDIRGPLATIIGLSELGREKSSDTESQFYFKHLTETGYRLDQTLRNLLQVMQLKDNEKNLTILNSEQLKAEILKIKQQYKNQKIDFKLEVDPAVHLSTDKELITTILKNLIDNSYKFSDESKKNPYIKITVDNENDSTVKIKVEDNGEGIENEIGNRVYDMFFRGNSRSKGSGLGLFITKRAVEKVDGTIDYTSIPNKLTTFTVRLNKAPLQMTF